LQKVESDLDTVTEMYCSLEKYASDLRDRFNDFALQASELCGQEGTEYEEDNKRLGRRKKNNTIKFSMIQMNH